jgi:hypothetical protein
MKDIDALLKELKSGLYELENNKEKALNNVGEKLIKDIKALTPVDTGKLKDSYKLSVNKDEVEVTTDVEYAVYVNDGYSTKDGSYVNGKYMFDKSINEAKKNLDKEVYDMFKNTKIFR